MKTTLDLLRDLARSAGPAYRFLASDAREIANRRDVDPVTAERFAVLEARLDYRDALPTAAELAELGALAREIA